MPRLRKRLLPHHQQHLRTVYPYSSSQRWLPRKDCSHRLEGGLFLTSSRTFPHSGQSAHSLPQSPANPRPLRSFPITSCLFKALLSNKRQLRSYAGCLGAKLSLPVLLAFLLRLLAAAMPASQSDMPDSGVPERLPLLLHRIHPHQRQVPPQIRTGHHHSHF
jgi:hypothetical protein